MPSAANIDVGIVDADAARPPPLVPVPVPVPVTRPVLRPRPREFSLSSAETILEASPASSSSPSPSPPPPPPSGSARRDTFRVGVALFPPSLRSGVHDTPSRLSRNGTRPRPRTPRQSVSVSAIESSETPPVRDELLDRLVGKGKLSGGTGLWDGRLRRSEDEDAEDGDEQQQQTQQNQQEAADREKEDDDELEEQGLAFDLKTDFVTEWNDFGSGSDRNFDLDVRALSEVGRREELLLQDMDEGDNSNQDDSLIRVVGAKRSATTSSAFGRSKKRARMPQTMGFHIDWWIGRMGSDAQNIDFKALCAGMMLWREKNEVWHPTCRVPPGQPEQPPPNGTYSDANALRNADGSLASTTDWDVLLAQMTRRSRQMHQTRAWRARGLKNAVGWCKWGRAQGVRARGDFVGDLENGLEVQREVECGGDDGMTKTWMLKLGYRREQPPVGIMEIDDE